MEGTDIFASEEEFKELKHLASMGYQSGEAYFCLTTAMGLDKEQKTVDAKKVCHKLALLHGLPEISGYYGINKDREFTKV